MAATLELDEEQRVDIVTRFSLHSIPTPQVLKAHEAAVIKAAEDVIANAELQYGEVEFLISNAGTDRHGESIVMEGIDTTVFETNPVVLWAHMYDSVPIGQVTKIWDDGKSKYARVLFDVENDGFANLVYMKILGGFIRAVSIGGFVTKFGIIEENGVTWTDWNTILEMEMIELSICAVGANPEALVTAKRLGFTSKSEQEAFTNFVKRDNVAPGDASRTTQLEKTCEALTAQVSALSSSVEALRAPDQETKKAVKRIVRKRKFVAAKTAAKNVDKLAEQFLSIVNAGLEEEFPNVKTTRSSS